MGIFGDFLEENYHTLKVVSSVPDDEKEQIRKSTKTWNNRRKHTVFADRAKLQSGQILWIDFGRAFEPEMAYTHPSLLLSYENKMCKVLPITSNTKRFKNAYHPEDNPTGDKLQYFVKAGECSLPKDSVILIEQLRTLSESRIIRIDDVNPIAQDIYGEITQILFEHLFPQFALQKGTVQMQASSTSSPT